MLFTSSPFLFAFLPVTLAVYYAALKYAGKVAAQLWLFAASLFFYGWWNPVYLVLILLLMVFNFEVGRRLLAPSPASMLCMQSMRGRERAGERANPALSDSVQEQPSPSRAKTRGPLPLPAFAGRGKKALLVFGLAANLGVLAYYKYAGFFIANLDAVTGADFVIPQIVLPLGISFFTFQKIAFLVDCYRRHVPGNMNWINFGLFISFFPQLIAGPIVHHREMMPQFDKPKAFSADIFAAGLCLLIIGLCKKTLIADNLDVYVGPLFEAAKTRPLHMLEAWAAMLAYTFQIYFDFSGYSDMALGLGKMFGVRLPVNFYSPYKARNIIDFWRRWHMTLSRFLRDYLYIPLGGSRHGAGRRYINLIITMLLGGLWHGAQWTYVLWGALHGVYLAVNHVWKATPPRRTPGSTATWIPAFRLRQEASAGLAPRHAEALAEAVAGMGKTVGSLLTFLAVAVAWVFFRADSVATAMSILSSLAHVGDFADYHPGRGPLRALFGAAPANRLAPFLLLCYLICRFAPNSVEIMRRGKPAIAGMRAFFPLPRSRTHDALAWRPSFASGLLFGTLLALCLVKVLYEPSQVFLYFQF